MTRLIRTEQLCIGYLLLTFKDVCFSQNIGNTVVPNGAGKVSARRAGVSDHVREL